jgi:hypothetical protein
MSTEKPETPSLLHYQIIGSGMTSMFDFYDIYLIRIVNGIEL